MYINTQADYPIDAIYQIIDNKFISSSALVAGAVYINNVNANITGNEFVNNTAYTPEPIDNLWGQGGCGGAIYLACTEVSSCDLSVDNN